MNGAFKGLKQSDVYLTSYISKKQWQVTSGSFENLGISKIEAASGSLPYVDLGPVMSIYGWEPTPNYEDYQTYRRLKAAGETDEYIRENVLTQYSGSSHDTQWSNLVNWSGGYYPKLAYRELDVDYYRGSLPNIGSFTGSYDLDLQSTITLQGGRSLPQNIVAYSIPRDCFGENIEEGSLNMVLSNPGVEDKILWDKEGLIFDREHEGNVLFTGSIPTRLLNYIRKGTGTLPTIFSGSIRPEDSTSLHFDNTSPRWYSPSQSLNGRSPLEVSSSVGMDSYNPSPANYITVPVSASAEDRTISACVQYTNYGWNTPIEYSIENTVDIGLQETKSVQLYSVNVENVIGEEIKPEFLLYTSGSQYNPNLSPVDTAGNDILYLDGNSVDPEWLSRGIVFTEDAKGMLSILSNIPGLGSDPKSSSLLVSPILLVTGSPVTVEDIFFNLTGSYSNPYYNGTGNLIPNSGASPLQPYYYAVNFENIVPYMISGTLPEGIKFFRVMQKDQEIFAIENLDDYDIFKTVRPCFSVTNEGECFVEINAHFTDGEGLSIGYKDFTEFVSGSVDLVTTLKEEDHLSCNHFSRDLILEPGKTYDMSVYLSGSGIQPTKLLSPSTWPVYRITAYSGSSSQVLLEEPNPFAGKTLVEPAIGQAGASHYTVESFTNTGQSGSLLAIFSSQAEISMSGSETLDQVYETTINKDDIRPGATYLLEFPDAESWFTGSNALLGYSPIQVSAGSQQYSLTTTGSFNLENTLSTAQQYRVSFRTRTNSGTVKYTRQDVSPGGVLGDIIYDRGLILLNKDMVSATDTVANLNWTSRRTVNTWNVRCTVKDREYNYTYNPTVTDELKAIMGTSKFTPYITSVGLYNRAGELMAVAKLSKPVRKNDNIDMTFKINIDIS